MSDRGTIERIAIDIAYPDGTTKRSVMEGTELERLAAIAFKRDAIGRLLKDEPTRTEALAVYDGGHAGNGQRQPAMLLLNDNQTYSMKCEPTDHRPHND